MEIAERINSSLQFLRDAALALVYPRGCAICANGVERAADGATCASCWAKTRFFEFDELMCRKCGRLLENSANQTPATTFCHRCDQDFFDFARAVGVYENALRVAVLELKEKPFVAALLKNRLQAAAQNPLFAKANCIVPIPLHAKRFRERTFNQTEVLARIVGEKLEIPTLRNCLTRKTFTAVNRAGMDERARRESIEDAFVVKQPRVVKDQNVLLVDDVFTTGATVSLSARALKEAGAKQVFVLTLARAADSIAN